MTEAVDQWLIRTQKNVIAGPVPKVQLLELITSGRLGPQDEVCRAGAYWFYLHEEPEVFNQLGIHAPRLPSGGDEEEITQTTRSHPVFPELVEPSGGFDPDRTGIVTQTQAQSVPEIRQARSIFQNKDQPRPEVSPAPIAQPVESAESALAELSGESIRRSSPQVIGSREPKISARVATFKTMLLVLSIAALAKIIWTMIH